MQLARFDPDLSLGELTRARDRHPLAERHRGGARQETGQTGDEDSVVIDRGAGHAHDQGEIGAETIVGAEHRRAQRVTADRAMPALETGEEASLQAARLRRHELLQDLRVPPLVGRHPGAGGLGRRARGGYAVGRR